MSILRADSAKVCLYVKIFKGQKVGHYFLQINAKNGQLIKASKLSDGGQSHLMPGLCYYQPAEKSTWLFGQKLSQQQYNPEQKYFGNNSENNCALYGILIDSLGNVADKQTFILPINDPSIGTVTLKQGYYFQLQKIARLGSGTFELIMEIYKNEISNNCCFYYIHTQVIHLVYDGEKYQLEKTVIQANAAIEQFYKDKDKLNTNGKICVDSLIALPWFYNKKPLNPVKLSFTFDQNNNGHWLLAKNDISKKQFVIAELGLKNTIYQLKTIESLNNDKHNCILVQDENRFIIGRQVDEKNFNMRLFHW
jgi:hypothetical protein